MLNPIFKLRSLGINSKLKSTTFGVDKHIRLSYESPVTYFFRYRLEVHLCNLSCFSNRRPDVFINTNHNNYIRNLPPFNPFLSLMNAMLQSMAGPCTSVDLLPKSYYASKSRQICLIYLQILPRKPTTWL